MKMFNKCRRGVAIALAVLLCLTGTGVGDVTVYATGAGSSITAETAAEAGGTAGTPSAAAKEENTSETKETNTEQFSGSETTPEGKETPAGKETSSEKETSEKKETAEENPAAGTEAENPTKDPSAAVTDEGNAEETLSGKTSSGALPETAEDAEKEKTGDSGKETKETKETKKALKDMTDEEIREAAGKLLDGAEVQGDLEVNFTGEDLELYERYQQLLAGGSEGLSLFATDPDELTVLNTLSDDAAFTSGGLMSYVYWKKPGNPHAIAFRVKYVADDPKDEWRMAYCTQLTKSFINATKYVSKSWKANGLYTELSWVMAHGCSRYKEKSDAEYTTGSWVKDYYVTQVVIWCVLEDHNLDGCDFSTLKSVSGYEDVYAAIKKMYKAVKDFEDSGSDDGFGDNPYYKIVAPSSVSMKLNADGTYYETEWYTIDCDGDLVSRNITITGDGGAEIYYHSDSLKSKFKVRIPVEKTKSMELAKTYTYRITATARFTRPKSYIYKSRVADAQNITFTDTAKTTGDRSSTAKAKLKLSGCGLSVKKSTSDASPAFAKMVAENPQYSLAGSTYAVYESSEDAREGRDALGTLICDDNGETEELSLNKEGTYYIKETKAGPGYQLNATVYTATISSGDSYVLETEDLPIYALVEIAKKDADTADGYPQQTSVSLENCRFRLCFYAGSKTSSGEAETAGDTADTGEDTAAGDTADTGEDTVAGDTADTGEDTAAGDTANTDEDTAAGNTANTELDETAEDTEVTGGMEEIEDTEGGDLTRNWVLQTLKTSDADNAERYAALLDAEHKISGSSFYTDASGQAILPLGRYTLEEIQAGEGLMLEDMYYTCSDTMNGAGTQLKAEDGKLQFTVKEQEDADGNKTAVVVMQDGQTQTEKLYITAFDHEGYGSLQVLKTDSATGEKLAGAEFELQNEDGVKIQPTEDNGITGDISADGTITTTADGSARVEHLPVGYYVLTEKKAPALYKISSEDVNLTVNGGKETTVTVEDERLPVKIGTTVRDAETEEHMAQAADQVTLTDTVAYENLTPGMTYEIKGVLMDRDSGERYTDPEGQEVTASASFTPETYDGSVEVTFSFNGSNLADRTLVVYEELYLKGEPVAEHKDLQDEFQTVYFPGVKTKAKDAVTGEHYGEAGKQITIQDSVAYTNLIAGKTYTVSGVLMDKATGEPLLADGEEVRSETTFTPETAEGTVTLTFTFNGLNLAGKTVVAFETISYKNTEVAVHADLEDEEQTVSYPAIGTQARNQETGTQEAMAKENITLVDTVSYENLIPGETYMIVGTLMDQESGEALTEDGNTLIGGTTFTPESSDGTADVVFTLDASALAGKSLVVFETLKKDGQIVAVHEDLEDEGQTITFPEIHTTLTNAENDSKMALAGDTVTLKDTVTYKNLKPGREYTLTGQLYDRESGEAWLSDDQPVVGETTFTPETSEGTAEVIFTFKGVNLAGHTLVAFEDLYQDQKQVAVHADIEDEDQSEYFPKIGTSARDAADSDQKVETSGTVTIIDTVTYENLVIGKTYTVTGTLMNKETGKELKISGKTITSSITFTPESTSGTAEVQFAFDVSGLGGKTIVVFERLYEQDAVIAVHEDLEDSQQTIVIPETPETPETPDTPETSTTPTPTTTISTPKTGVEDHLLLYLFLMMTAGISAAYLLMQGRKKLK